jgi:GntR family transcriptional regulator/MocR family aminotransferase
MPKKPSGVILPFLSVERSAGAEIGGQIYSMLRRAIDDGVLRSGFRLPSSRELARQAGVGRNSVNDAYRRLIVEGFLRGRSGSGTYVVGPAVTVHPKRSRVTLSRWAAHSVRHASSPRTANRPFALGAAAFEEFSWPRWLQLVSQGWRSWREGTPEPEPHGAEELRMAIAERAAVVSGISCSPDEVIVSSAGEGLVMALARLIADPGDAILIDDPTDRATRFLLELIGLRCEEAVIGDDGLDVERAVNTEVRAALLRPSAEGARGVVMAAGRRYATMSWAKAHGTSVIEDDFDAIVDPAVLGLRSLKSLDSMGVCIYVADLSRSLMPGIRMSYAIAPRVVVDAWRATDFLPVKPPTIGEQLALAAFLRSGDFPRQIARMRSAYTERRDTLMAELTSQLRGGVTAIERRGPLQLILRISDELRDVSVAEAAAELGLDVMPLSPFSADEQGLIVGYGGSSPKQLKQAVTILAEAFSPAAAGITAF